MQQVHGGIDFRDVGRRAVHAVRVTADMAGPDLCLRA